jgi:CRP-like cAMP-binding protein
MRSEARSSRLEEVAAHPLAELLACPPHTGSLLNASAQTIQFETGDTIFRQAGPCAGLYLVVQGQLLRRTDRLETRISLGLARPGELVELAAALAEQPHTYSLVAQTSGSMMMLPIDALSKAFDSYPPLRMQLLEELAREVSRAYHTCAMNRSSRKRRSSTRIATA